MGELNTNLSVWVNSYSELVKKDFDACGVSYDDYSKRCAMNAMTEVYNLVQNTDKADMKSLDASNLREVIGNVASLKLNSMAVPRECYFQLRTKVVDGKYVKRVEMGIEGDGNDSILRNFGVNVEQVYPCWIVKEGDDFSYPEYSGIDVKPPTWKKNGKSLKTRLVCYPVKLKDGSVEYLISERESVKTNLMAHVRNNLMNETFGLVKGGKKTRYDATPEEKKAIDERKSQIFETLRKCETVDDMLQCEIAKPWISAAWLDTPESMITRKMRNNAIKPFPKDFNAMAKVAFLSTDETYSAVKEEIKDNENSVDFEAEIVSEQNAEEA